jgi:hypothetical protein
MHKIQARQGSKTDKLEKTVAWTPRTLKMDKRRKDMAKTKFRGFSVNKQGSRGLTTRIQGLKHNYVYKPKVYNVKIQDWDLG